MTEKRVAAALGALSIGILLWFFCGQSHGAGKKAPVPTPSVIPSISPSPQSTPITGFKYEPVPGYATAAEQVKIQKAGLLVNVLAQSTCLKDFMVKRALIQTGGKTNEQVVDAIRNASLTVPVSIYYRRFTSAVAFRQPPDPTIHLNRRNFTPQVSDCEWASTMLHETSHVLGFEHDYKWNPQRDFSVPYSLNKAVEACCK